MTVVGNQARMGGYKRFWVGEYNGGVGLSKNVVICPKIGDKGDGLGLALIPAIGSSIGGGEW